MASTLSAIVVGAMLSITLVQQWLYRILFIFFSPFRNSHTTPTDPKTSHASPIINSPPSNKILIPDLVSHCTFEIHLNSHVDRAVQESKDWLFAGGNLSEKRKDAFRGLKAGGELLVLPLLLDVHTLIQYFCLELTSMCYPYAEFDQLRVCCDFMNYLFHLDDLSDDMDNEGTSSTGDEVMNTLYHPDTYNPQTRVGKLTRE
jgi:hypothetical protein